jgi:hypothetical protein
MFNFEEITERTMEITKNIEKAKIRELLEKGNGFAVIRDNGTLDIFGVCGFAVIKFRDYRKAFARAWLKESGSRSYFSSCSTQELSIQRECANKVCEYLNKTYNADAYVYSWVD